MSHGGAMGGRGRGRRHGRRQDDPKVALSKALTWLLRHGAEEKGFTLRPGGYLFVDDILATPRYSKYTLEDVRHVVLTNEKQRFHMEEEPESGRLQIRANQGHTLQVEELDLKPITDAAECPIVVHGTYYKAWDAIKTEGLCRMNRNHIHFAEGEPGDEGVISGMRRSCQVLIYIDLEKALTAGIPFFRSSNNVILSPGDTNGRILPKFFSNVQDRKSKAPLDFR